MMGSLLSGKSVVIIGGTSGIGASAACRFVDEGAHVTVLGLPDTEPVSLPPHVCVLEGDVLTDGVVERVFKTACDCFGGVHALYHVAGGSGRKFGDGPLAEMSREAWQSTLDLNLTGVMLSNRVALRHFLEQGHGGAILNMSSVLAWAPEPPLFETHAYAAAKSAVIGLSRSLAASYAPRNIRVNVIAPGLVDTPMARRAKSNPEIMRFMTTKQPLDGGRMALPEDLDAAAALLLSDQSRFITGQVLAVDGGWSL